MKQVDKLLYFARNIRSQKLFQALRIHSCGNVLDVGGWDFYKYAISHGIEFNSWTILDMPEKEPPNFQDPRIKFVAGDGCQMDLISNTFNTVLSIQVLEHVFEPNRMFAEMSRVLKPGGHLIILIPQTSNLHLAPQHYYNFTRYWPLEAIKRQGLELISIKPLGGRWSSIASNLLYFLFQSFYFRGMVVPEYSRSLFFWLLWPFMFLFVAIAFPICMIFSIVDLKEEPNNHLVIAQKPD